MLREWPRVETRMSSSGTTLPTSSSTHRRHAEAFQQQGSEIFEVPEEPVLEEILLNKDSINLEPKPQNIYLFSSTFNLPANIENQNSFNKKCLQYFIINQQLYHKLNEIIVQVPEIQ